MSLIKTLAWTENPENPLQIEFYIFLNKKKLNTNQKFRKFLGENYQVVDLQEYAEDLVRFLFQNYKDVKDFIEDKLQDGYDFETIDMEKGGGEDKPTITITIVLEKEPTPKKRHLKAVK